MFAYFRIVFPSDDGDEIEGHVDIQNPVVQAELPGDTLAVATDTIIPGGKPDHYNVSAFHKYSN
jgi:hypothetical protein